MEDVTKHPFVEAGRLGDMIFDFISDNDMPGALAALALAQVTFRILKMAPSNDVRCYLGAFHIVNIRGMMEQHKIPNSVMEKQIEDIVEEARTFLGTAENGQAH